MALVITSKKQ